MTLAVKMAQFSFKIVMICFLVFVGYIKASSLEELKKNYMEVILECSKEFPVPAADMEQLRAKQVPQSQSAKCLFGCAYKKTGMMDEQGMLSVEGVNAIAEKYLSDDPVKMQMTKEFTEACKSVNDATVSDGDKGCERAALLFKCTIEKAPQFDFGI